VHLFDPHAPYRPPPPFDQQYASQPYYGEVAATDAALTPLLDEVARSPRPTLVIVTGDHGEALGDHGEQSHGLFAYESTLRIPLIVSEVGGRTPQTAQRPAASTVLFGNVVLAAGGEVSSAPARHVDLLPTILDAVGLAQATDRPGRSLLTARDRAADTRPSYFEAMSATLNRGWAPLAGVLVDREKYIDLPIPERYDLQADAAERVNLAGRAADRDRLLAAALRGFAAGAPGSRRAEDADVAARLRALGYASGSAPTKASYGANDDPKTLVELDRAVHDAVEAFAAGRPSDAVRIYQGVITRRPDMGIAYRHLAFVEWQRENADGAIDTLRRAVKAGVSDPRVVSQLGGYLTETGRIAEGIHLLESVVREAASTADVEALNALGIAYAQAGQLDAARATFERVLAVNAASSVPRENLGLLALDRGDLAEARRQFDQAIEVNPASSRAHGGLGNVALRAGDRDRAIAEWKRAVELDRRNLDALYNIGVTLARAGQRDAARPYLEQFIRAAPPARYKKDLEVVGRLLASTSH
jgi:tetratricopeptide (TPR) repeat protein